MFFIHMADECQKLVLKNAEPGEVFSCPAFLGKVCIQKYHYRIESDLPLNTVLWFVCSKTLSIGKNGFT